jgi:hypothetical protein
MILEKKKKNDREQIPGEWSVSLVVEREDDDLLVIDVNASIPVFQEMCISSAEDELIYYPG